MEILTIFLINCSCLKTSLIITLFEVVTHVLVYLTDKFVELEFTCEDESGEKSQEKQSEKGLY